MAMPHLLASHVSIQISNFPDLEHNDAPLLNWSDTAKKAALYTVVGGMTIKMQISFRGNVIFILRVRLIWWQLRDTVKSNKEKCH